jgi:hypothetical protein
MPICHERRFAFLHVPKTGGVSVTNALRRAGVKLEFDREVSILPRLLQHPLGGALVRRLKAVYPLNTVTGFAEVHVPASLLFELTAPEVQREYFSFAFVRNPWDLLVSMFHYWRNVFSIDERLGRLDPDFPPLLADDFSSFVRRYPIVGSDQTAFLSDADGTLMPSFIGRVERLDEDFAEVCRRIGICASLERENTTAHGPYREYYDTGTRAIVEGYFARDIAAFGYRF